MRAFGMLKRPLVSISALAGLGLVTGLAFATDRLAARDTLDITAACTKLNVGKSDGCARAYLTKAQFDDIFAEVETASKLNAKDAAVFAEKLRLVGTKRLVPARSMDKHMVVRTRLASLDPATALLDVDTTLYTSFLDRAAIFSLLMEDPKAPPDTRVSQSVTGPSGS
jgi:hypothetical protein